MSIGLASTLIFDLIWPEAKQPTLEEDLLGAMLQLLAEEDLFGPKHPAVVPAQDLPPESSSSSSHDESDGIVFRSEGNQIPGGDVGANAPPRKGFDAGCQIALGLFQQGGGRAHQPRHSQHSRHDIRVVLQWIRNGRRGKCTCICCLFISWCCTQHTHSYDYRRTCRLLLRREMPCGH